jgi:hypothetical protein
MALPLFFFALLLVSSCEGPKGPAGTDGTNGVNGTNGTNGINGTDAVACLAPCHNSGGVWEQYYDSRHFAEILLAEEQESFTNNTGRSCAACHAKDAIASRLDGMATSGGTLTSPELGHIGYWATNKFAEAGYDGEANFAQIRCLTCHVAKTDADNHHENVGYTAGNLPLRTTTTAGIYIEKSAAAGTAAGTQLPNYGTGNTCLMCHKSRKDVTDYINTTNVSLTSRHWGPHEGPGADLYSGEGGYEFSGKTYTNAFHVASLTKACVSCHMTPIAENGNYGNHDFKAKVGACAVSGCHTGATSISDIQTASVANMETLLKQLQDAFNTYDLSAVPNATNGILSQTDNSGDANDSVAVTSDPNLSSSASTRFANIYHDAVRMQRVPSFNPATGKWSRTNISVAIPKDHAGALYNYFVVVRSKGYGYHNYKYAAQLIYDSIEALGLTPTGTRP